MVAATPSATGIMDVTLPTLKTIWWAATASTPMRPIRSVTIENTVPSKNMVTPMGRPSFTSRQITAKSGIEKRENAPARRTRE